MIWRLDYIYIEVEKSVSGFGTYPLCIIIDKDEREMLFERGTGAVICLETIDTKRFSLALANSNLCTSDRKSVV